MADVGYWVGVGAPSAVDWCEPNYVVTPYVAEFVNTFTSVPMSLLGLYGLAMSWRHRDVIPRRFWVCFAGLACVGIGSVAFHGSLLRSAQALDELPMVYAILASTWVTLLRTKPRGDGLWTAIAMILYSVGFTVAYFWSAATFLIFLATFGVLTAFVAFYSMWINVREPTPAPMPTLAQGAFWSFAAAFFLFWIPEHAVFACDAPIQGAYLHGWWHVLGGLGVYLWICWAVVDRMRQSDVRFVFRRGFVFPVR